MDKTILNNNETLRKNLNEALRKGNIELGKEIILTNKNVLDFKDRYGRSVLFDAIEAHDYEGVKILIELGANVNLADSQLKTPLHYAVIENKLEVVDYLIQSGANVNAIDVYGNSIILEAVFYSNGKFQIIEILKKNGADPLLANASGINAIALAKTISNYDVKKCFPDY